MSEENQKNSKDIEDSVIAECSIKGRKFVITVDKKIYEKASDGRYKECLENNPETYFLKKYTEPPKSLDVEKDDR